MKDKVTTMRIVKVMVGLSLLAGTGLMYPAFAAPADAEATRPAETELIYRQQYLKKQFADLTRMMLEVADLLTESEPACARAIRQAVDQAQRSFIDDDMDKVVSYLNKGLTSLAGTAQAGVVEELKKVLETLQSSPLDPGERAEQIRRWKQFLTRVNELIQRQQAHQRDAHLASEGKQLAEQMRELGKKLAALITRQEKLLKETSKLPPGDEVIKPLVQARREIRRLIRDQTALNKESAKATPGKLLLASEKQKDLKVRAEMVAAPLSGSKRPGIRAAAVPVRRAADQMGQAAGKLAATDAPAAKPHQEQALADLQAAEKALSDAINKQGASSRAAGLGKQQKQLAGDTGKLSEAVKAAEAKAGMGSPAESGSKSNLDKAAGHMDKAAGSLGEQDKNKAAKSEAEALKEMRKEADRLAELARKLEEAARKADLERQKQAQDATAKQTGQTAEDMKKSSKDGQPTPGQKSVSSASKSMQQASKSLGQGKACSACSKQGQAVEQLKKAAEDLQRAIDQAREAEQEETLVEVEQTLREVLARQKTITESTGQTYQKRSGKQYDRPGLLKLAELSDGEGALAEKIAKILKMIRKENTTAVFPMVLDEIRSDLTNVQGLLARKKAGPLTQSMQKSVEKNLEELIAALQKEMRRRKRKKKGGSCPGGGGGGAPLVPPVAELKMLRSLQMRINKRTLTLDTAKRSGEAPEAELKGQYKIIAEREARLIKTTRELNEKMKRRRR